MEATFTRAAAPPATFTLVLTEDEALYVYAALRYAKPARTTIAPDGGDPVWNALGAALNASGVGAFGDGDEYAVRN